MNQYTESNIKSYNYLRTQQEIKYYTLKIARTERYLKRKWKSSFHSKDEINNLISSINQHREHIETLKQELLLPFI